MIQPGVYFAFDAPFVRILGLYSKVLEDPGVIPSENGTYPRVSDQQLTFLTNQLNSIKNSNFQGALIVATHHPPQVVGRHGASPMMLQQMDSCFSSSGVHPHAVFSGHAHNYQVHTAGGGAADALYGSGNGRAQ